MNKDEKSLIHKKANRLEELAFEISIIADAVKSETVSRKLILMSLRAIYHDTIQLRRDLHDMPGD